MTSSCFKSTEKTLWNDNEKFEEVSFATAEEYQNQNSRSMPVETARLGR